MSRRSPRRLFDFYPRPPRGGRLAGGRDDRAAGKFLSTPSARRATADVVLSEADGLISIHALREEGDFLFGGLASGAK